MSENLKSLLTRGAKATTAAATASTFHSHYLTIKGQSVNDKLIQAQEQIKLLENKINQNNLAKLNNRISDIEVQSLNNDLNLQIQNLIYEKERLFKALSDFNSNTLATDIKFHAEQSLNHLDKTSETVNKIVDTIINNKGSNNFTDLFDDIIKNWSDFLKSLTFEQLNALSHILAALLVLLCLIDIILIIYNDFLITFFKLEERFPKLAKFIQLRRKFQRFHMSVSFIICFITLIGIIYLDLLFLSL
jgi:DNA repair ATPase RecN